MAKKLKLYGLIGLFLTLASCDDSCDYVFYSQLNSGRFVYAGTSSGIFGLGGASVFPIMDVQAIDFDMITAAAKYAGPGFDHREIHPLVATSSKPPMWAVSSSQNAVYLIDSNTDVQRAKIPVGQAPKSAVMSPNNAFLYVTNSGSNSISVIDTNTQAVTTISLNAGSKPTGIAVTPDGSSLFVINSALNSVSQVDLAKKSVAATFSVGQGPTSLAVTPDGLLLYVLNGTDNNIGVYDVLSLEKVQTITGIANPTSIAFTMEGKKAYITSGTSPSGQLYTLRTKSYALGTTPVKVGNNPVFVTLDTYNTLIYVANKGSGTLTILNGDDLSVAGTISLGGSPTSVVSLP